MNGHRDHLFPALTPRTHHEILLLAHGSCRQHRRVLKGHDRDALRQESKSRRQRHNQPTEQQLLSMPTAEIHVRRSASHHLFGLSPTILDRPSRHSNPIASVRFSPIESYPACFPSLCQDKLSDSTPHTILFIMWRRKLCGVQRDSSVISWVRAVLDAT